MSGKGIGFGWVVAKTKTWKLDNTNSRVKNGSVTSTCTHNGPVFYYKSTQMCTGSAWKQYQVFTAKLEPFIGTILLAVVNLHGWQKAHWKSH